MFLFPDAMPRASRLRLALLCALLPALPAVSAEASTSSTASTSDSISASDTPSENTPGSDTEADTLDTVRVTGARIPYRTRPSRSATRTDTPDLLVPQSVQTVGRAVLEDQNALNLTDAVRNVAGAGADFGFSGGSLPLLVIRGFPSVSMSARGPTTSSYYRDGTRLLGVPVAMADVETVEVIKGPASVLFGRVAPGGLVNVATRGPQAERGGALAVSVGDFGLVRGAVEARGALDAAGRWQGRIGLSSDDNGASRDFVVDRLQSGSASLAWVPSERTRLTLGLDRSRQRYRNDYGIPAVGDRPADIDRDHQFNEGGPLSRQDNSVVRVGLSHRWSERWRIDARALGLDQDGAQYDLIPTTFFSGREGLAETGRIDRLYSYEPERTRRLYQFNADLVGRFDTGEIAHTLLFGVDAYRDRFESLSTGFVPGPSIDIRRPDYGRAPALDLSTVPVFAQDGVTRWTGVYLQDQIDIGARLSLLAGLRHDRTEARFGEPDARPNRQNFTTPRLGAVWRLSPTQSLYGQYQEGVSANNGRNLAGESLDSEQARLYEIGHKYGTEDGGFGWTLAVYRLDKRNISNYVPDVSGFFDTVTLGEARAQGLEFDVSGRLGERVSLIASYAYTDTEVLRDAAFEGRRLPNAPRHAGSVWLRYAHDARWSVGGGLFGQGARAGDQGETFVLPGYVRMDLMAAYRFALGEAKAQVQLNIDNVFDRRYFTGSHQHVTDWNQPGEPRSAALTLRIDY